MKFPVVDKFSKYSILIINIIGWIVLIFLIVITAVHNINLWNELVEAGIWLAVFAVIILAFQVSYPILWVIWGCSRVIVDENGVKLSLGRLTLNQIKWQDIKRIEIFEERNIQNCNRLIINVLKIDNETKMSKTHTSAPNWGRKRITFIYNKDALPLLQEYCQCSIYGLSLAEEYSKQSTKFWQK